MGGEDERLGIYNTPNLPFSSHSLRRSGRSSALPYPQSEQRESSRWSYIVKEELIYRAEMLCSKDLLTATKGQAKYKKT